MIIKTSVMATASYLPIEISIGRLSAALRPPGAAPLRDTVVQEVRESPALAERHPRDAYSSADAKGAFVREIEAKAAEAVSR